MTATDTNVQSAPPAPGASPPPAGRAVGSQLLHLLGSMKLAVWLLLILAALTWLGTLAQTTRSTYDVQREYFESWFVIADLPLYFWGNPLFGGADGNGFLLRIPLPGAYPVLALLLVNLLVGGMLRMKWHARNAGVLIVHVGIALLLIAGGVKLHGSYSGALAVYETPADGNLLPGRVYETSRFVSFHDYELALLRDDGDTIEERTVPEHVLWAARDAGSVTLSAPDLPFTVQVHHFVDHSRALPKGPMVNTAMPVVDGAFLRAESWPPGEQPQSEREIAGCYVTVFGKNGERFDGILWGLELLPHDLNRYPFTFTIDGVRWGLDLRHVVADLPFAVQLDKFQKLDHPGTTMPRDFRSFVSVDDGTSETEAQVFMNNPLRKDGFVLYQSNWGPQPMGGPPWYSVFEVSYNPSDVWPAIGCAIIALGLLVHFSLKLSRFLKSSTRGSLQA